MTIAWDAFYPTLAPWVQTCTYPLMDQELRRAAQEFYTRTRAWCKWLDPIAVVADDRDYTIVLPTGTTLVRIEAVNVGTEAITPASYRDRKSNPVTTPNGTIEAYTPDAVTLVLDKTYSAGQDIAVFAAIAPTRTATGIDDYLFNMDFEAIVCGAKARLMAIPGTQFENQQAALQARSEFDAAIAQRHLLDWRGSTNAKKRTATSFF